MSLADKRILITRQREQAMEFISEIERRGGVPVVFPTITITDPDSWEACDRALRRVGDYAGVIFTSTNGWEKFLQRFQLCGLSFGIFGGVALYAVGETTRRSIEMHGLTVRFVPDTFSASSLARHFRHDDVDGKRFLLPQGDKGREEIALRLSKLGAIVDTVIVYNTVPADERDAGDIRQRLANGEIDVVTFASPSAAENFFKLVSPLDGARLSERTKIAVIGPTTGETVRRLGLDPDIVARESTVSGLVRAIELYYEEQCSV